MTSLIRWGLFRVIFLKGPLRLPLILAIAGFNAWCSDGDIPPQRLRIGIVQMAVSPILAENCDRIIAGISNAALHRVRVAVFPEATLRGDGSDSKTISLGVDRIREAARGTPHIRAVWWRHARASREKGILLDGCHRPRR